MKVISNQSSMNLTLFLILLIGGCKSVKQEYHNRLIPKILKTDGLVAFWDFSELAGSPRKNRGLGGFLLHEKGGEVPRVAEGPLSGYSASFGEGAYLNITNEKTGALNIHGKGQGVTAIAWVKWVGGTGFVGGMWNEYEEGGKRQYGLFISLPHYNGADQVCGHISWSGGPTPPFPYSIDYSASPQKLEKGKWYCVAFTYDGEWIRSFVNGGFISREPELIDHTKGFPGYPGGLVQSKNPFYFPHGMGNNGSDFTVIAVRLEEGMGNLFRGQIGGLAVFDRALDPTEIARLSDK